ncbi:hypothetical protein [Pseudochelatococcus contaminans]|uniref:Uncharacterized protein n=1 Tax=Pseudochelatococcus contaminans TaxID=1538103 RepID=A0A7W5Z3I4_9HYPH|nr:hypothetical protein [Pseudochelatococcus contaminans]MBB3809485.1 hypothetical protein [Pseudochelatococcus contaminans]
MARFDMARIDFARSGLRNAGIAAGFAVSALVAGASGAMAQQPADNSGIFMRDVLGSLGIVEKEAPQIDYRERPNLVLPPGGGALPAPRAGGAQAGQANWPNDPDVAARQRAIDAANEPVPVNRETGRLLSPDELRAGRRAGAGPQAPSFDTCYGDSCSARPLDPRELRNTGPIRSQQPVIAHGQEPERQTLTQPPTGYRMPAANAPIPEKEVSPIERIDPSSPYFFLNRQK